jgi:hypothetical protein
VDSGLINAAMSDYRAEVEAYMTANHPDATVGDVLGYKRIEEQALPIFPGTLPNTHISTSTRMSALTNTYRHRLTFSVSPKESNYYVEPFSITYALPELAGRKITLSYSPATQADEDVINSFLPAPHADGTPIDPSELPTSLPAYMINLKPELRVDGAVVATGGAVMMGSAENMTMTFHDPTRGDDVVSNVIEAGEYWNAVLDLGSISKKHIDGIRAKLDEVNAMYATGAFDGFTRDVSVGGFLETLATPYYVAHDALDRLLADSLNLRAVRIPSELIMKYDMRVEYSYGVPTSASITGLTMDVDRNLSIIKERGGNPQSKLHFMQMSGIVSSALEHEVPERGLKLNEKGVEGLSAVRALSYATKQGIPVYQITSENAESTLPSLNLPSEIIDEMRNAINAGNVVITPQTHVIIGEMIGYGYVIQDPVTGSGAYLISGGDGGWKIIQGIAMNIEALMQGDLLHTPGSPLIREGEREYWAAMKDFYVGGWMDVLDMYKASQTYQYYYKYGVPICLLIGTFLAYYTIRGFAHALVGASVLAKVTGTASLLTLSEFVASWAEYITQPPANSSCVWGGSR